MPLVDLETVFERLSRFPIANFKQDDFVLVEGTRTGRLLFLIQGVVDVVKDGWHIARVAKPGAVFGDMAALRDQPHSADVVAIEPSSFFMVADAASLLKTEPLISLYVAMVQSGRLDAANHTLIAARRQLATPGSRNRKFLTVLDQIGGALHAAS